MNRRTLLQTGLGALAARSAAAAGKRRAAVIGHTGHGNYGHGIDTVWKAFDSIEVVAVADPDDAGCQAALERTGAARAYRDYREMLAREKPDLVSIGPRWLDQRVEMVTAAADAGAHIYLEKPFARSVAEADQMVAAIERNRVTVQLAHQMRRSPFVARVREMIAAGQIGMIQEIRGRGKEDPRAGGEDMMVLGSHICDVMRMIAGDPRWVFAHVTEDGAELQPGDVRKPSEPIGPIAGNQIAAMYAFDGGVHGYFSSKANDQTDMLRFGTHIFGSKGVIFLPNGIYPDGQPLILRSPAWVPGAQHDWERIEAPRPAIRAADPYTVANALMVLDLLAAIDEDRPPACSHRDGLWTIEMITGVYRSQISGERVTFPLENRSDPLEAFTSQRSG